MSDADERLAKCLAMAHEEPGDQVIAVVGPTGSGKTALAIDLAEQVSGEILSCDSVQIYRGFDIGSGKPSAEELARVPHHLIGAIDPLEPIDAARYAETATRALEGVRARGKRPIVCGGTFLWVKALLFGLAEAPAANPELRARYTAVVEAEGRPALHARLREVDAASAERLHPNDFVRVSRALEVYELTGRPMSVWQAEHGFARPRHHARVIAIARTSEELTARIEARVAAFFAAGWIEETRGLIARGYRDARAMGSVGYREVRAHLEGEVDATDLERAVVRATRVFARRQRTWLNQSEVTWV